MNLDHANAQPHDLLHVTLGVGSMPRMHAAARNQPLGIFLHIVGDKCVDGRSESNQLRRDIIDEHRAIDADLVQMLEKLLRRAAELDHLIEVGALPLHGSQRRRFEHLNRLNVNVAVGDHWQSEYIVALKLPPSVGGERALTSSALCSTNGCLTRNQCNTRIMHDEGTAEYHDYA